MLPLGFLVFTAALFALAQCETGTSLIMLVVIHVLIYQGLAFSMSPAQTSALATLSPDMNAHGVAIVNTSMQIAASVGASLLGGIQAFRQANALASGMKEAQAISYGFSGAIYATVILGIIGFIIAVIYGQKAESRASQNQSMVNASEKL